MNLRLACLLGCMAMGWVVANIAANASVTPDNRPTSVTQPATPAQAENPLPPKVPRWVAVLLIPILLVLAVFEGIEKAQNPRGRVIRPGPMTAALLTVLVAWSLWRPVDATESGFALFVGQCVACFIVLYTLPSIVVRHLCERK